MNFPGTAEILNLLVRTILYYTECSRYVNDGSAVYSRTEPRGDNAKHCEDDGAAPDRVSRFQQLETLQDEQGKLEASAFIAGLCPAIP
jgi:hypothetical protein